MLLLHFLRLVRFGNLMVIGVTMCIVQAFIALHGNAKYSAPIPYSDFSVASLLGEGNGGQIEHQGDLVQTYFLQFNFDLNFLLLILSVLLIAGAGNIINDYFDVKADRVNKPEKMVIEKHIKRRWAIMFNWIFNAVGLLLAIYLSYAHQNWWIAIIAFLTINFLWFYSALYKRRIFVGNIIVAFLVGIVPIYVLIYNFPLAGFQTGYFDTFIDFGTLFVIKVVVIISTIAFVINLMREIIKDMADIRGDMHLSARTVPIALGIKRTKLILSLLLIPLLALMGFYIFDITHYSSLFSSLARPEWHVGDLVLFQNLYWLVIFVAMSALICIVSFAILLTSNTRKKYLLSSNLLKLAMLFGMVSPLFL